jgi:hypothetical protein
VSIFVDARPGRPEPMTDIGYDPESLRRAGARHRSTGTSAADLGGLLERVALDPTALGDVAHAAAFHGATVAARDTQAREAREEGTRRADLAERAETTAGIGENLTFLTTEIAPATPVPPVPGLLGPGG